MVEETKSDFILIRSSVTYKVPLEELNADGAFLHELEGATVGILRLPDGTLRLRRIRQKEVVCEE